MDYSVPICPRCGQADATCKVSSLVAGGVSAFQIPDTVPVSLGGKTYLIPSHRTGTSATLLAQMLAFPLKEPPGYKRVRGPLTAACIFVGLGFLLQSGPIQLVIILFGLALWYFLIILFFVLTGKLRKNVRQDKEFYNRAVTKWHHLYYCYRDDGVFIPGDSRFIPVAQTKSFLIE